MRCMRDKAIYVCNNDKARERATILFIGCTCIGRGIRNRMPSTPRMKLFSVSVPSIGRYSRALDSEIMDRALAAFPVMTAYVSRFEFLAANFSATPMLRAALRARLCCCGRRHLPITKFLSWRFVSQRK